MPADPRFAAFTLLHAVLDGKQALDQVLESSPDLKPLEPRDRAFARLLAATVLRRLGTLDRAIDGALARPGLHPAARHVLRLGLAQLRYLGTPPHAAISTSVDLAGVVVPRLKGLVNAILRRHESLEFDDRPEINLPGWLWRRWFSTYGVERAAAIAAASLREAPLDITVKADPAPWTERLEAEIMPLGTLRRQAGGAVQALPGYDEGAWWVQDLAAALPARLMGDVRGKTVFDLCAAPGGKTAQLAAMGAEVTAVDRSSQRLKRLAANMARLKLEARLVEADAAAWVAGRKADAILLDAPCLATGTLRRHPDIPHLKLLGDLAGLVALQARLLDHAATLLTPGGTLVYCTCSLEPEEGERQVAAFLERTPGVARRAILSGELPGLEDLLTPEGDIRALPCHLAERGGMDGFYVARLAAR